MGVFLSLVLLVTLAVILAVILPIILAVILTINRVAILAVFWPLHDA